MQPATEPCQFTLITSDISKEMGNFPFIPKYPYCMCMTSVASCLEMCLGVRGKPCGIGSPLPLSVVSRDET